MKRWSLLWIGILLCGTSGWSGCNASVPSVALPVKETSSTTGQSLPREYPVTFANCASAGCHGGSVRQAAGWENAASIWQANDPHRQAFVVLYTERAVQMVKRLEQWAEDSPVNEQEYLFVLEQRCTGCHAVHESTESASKAEQYALGVTCTACHGEATAWGHAHYHAGWRDEQGKLIPSDATAGFQDLQELPIRAETCVKCHLGPGTGLGRQPHDMNHDLIAAGHPRLNFEFNAYLRALPAHWNVSQDRSRYEKRTADASAKSTFHFDCWLVGQQALAKQRERLQAERAKLDNAFELSQFECYQCHHAYAAALTSDEDGLDSTVNNWRQNLSSSRSQPLASSQNFVAHVLHAADLPLRDPAGQRELLRSLFTSATPRSFDDVLCGLLAVDAWLADQPAAEYSELRERAENLRTALQQGFPTQMQATVYDSPASFRLDHSSIEKAWQAIGEQLSEQQP